MACLHVLTRIVWVERSTTSGVMQSTRKGKKIVPEVAVVFSTTHVIRQRNKKQKNLPWERVAGQSRIVRVVHGGCGWVRPSGRCCRRCIERQRFLQVVMLSGALWTKSNEAVLKSNFIPFKFHRHQVKMIKKCLESIKVQILTQ